MEKIKAYLQEYSYLKSFQALMYWDLETMMPSGAIEDRAKRLSYIQGKMHSHITSSKYGKLLSAEAKKKLKPLAKKLLKELKWDYELNKALPARHVHELVETQTHANHVWAKARKENDWESFRPWLQKLIDIKRRETKYFKEKKPYDALIKLHDKEFTSTQISEIFMDLRKGLIKLADKVEREGRFVHVKELKGPFDISKQQELSKYVANCFGLTSEFSRLDISSHPFSINISPLDQRITTRYDEFHLDSLSSTMHEVGHALYELNLPREWEGTPFQEAISLSVHESQSRFWENIIGRSKSFCHFIHSKIKEIFPHAMKGVNEEELFLYFNKSTPGLIRVESCELYYNLHIIIRFEIEEMIFNQGLNADELPVIWNEKYQEYLGISAKNYTQGVLQDTHWSGASFGYFPTYTLGNLISGSLYQQMKKEIRTFEKDIFSGDFSTIRSYLVDNIHSKGRSITSHDLVGKINVDDYLKYLDEKFKG